MRFSAIRPAETPQPTKMKFCTIDYVGKLTRCAKNDCNRLAGGCPTDRWNITSTFLLYLIFTLPVFILVCLYSPDGWTDLHARQLKRRGLLHESAFWGSRWYEITSRGQNPRKPQILEPECKFPAKSMHSNNFWTAEHKRKISTDSVYKIRVGESSCDIISVLRRHLTAKTTSGPILKL